MNRTLRSQLPPNPRDLAVFDTTTGSSPGRTRGGFLKKFGIPLLSMLFMLMFSVTGFGQLSNYAFTSSAGTYTAIVGGTQAVAGATDSGNSGATPIAIGFNFVFNGTTYTQFSVAANGWIRLGATVATTTGTTPISTPAGPSIALFARDGKTGGAVTYQVSGAAPNRVLTVQFPNYNVYWNSTANTLDMQVKLYETTNVVQIVYGASASVTAYAGQVGLGWTVNTNYNNRTSTTSWTASTAGTVATATMNLAPGITPTNGLTYTWTPPFPCASTPAAPVAAFTGASSICAGTTKAMSATGFTTGQTGLTVQWQSSTDGVNFTDIAGATAATYTTAAMAAGTYYYRVNSTCTNTAQVATSNVITLTVNALPVVSISAPNAGAFCGAQTLTANGAATYAWTPATSLSSGSGTSVLFTGTASVTVNVSGTDANGCVGTASQAVTYTAPTAISVTASVPTFCGTGGTSTLTASSAVAYDYVWSVNETGTLSTTTGATTDFTIAQTSSARVIGTDVTTGCSAIANYSVGVYPLPSATVTTTASGVCPGTPATINSGLSAGNFSVTSIPYVPFNVPATAVTVVTNGAAVAPFTLGGSYDDGGFAGIPIGFNFNYFGTTQTTIAAGTNGLLMFGTPACFTTTAGCLGQYNFSTTPAVFPNPGNPGNVIALMAGDQYFTGATGGNATIKYWVEGYAPNRRFVLLYQNVPNCCSATNPKFTAYVVLYETLGMVDIHIQSKLNTNSCTVGLQNATGTIGAVAPGRQSFTSTITTPEAWRFTPPANYLTVWSATDANGTYSVTTNVDGSTVNTINGFSATVAPLITTTYSISYANATTGCSNILSPAQVTMNVLGTVAPTGVNATSTLTTACPGTNIPLATSYTGSLDGLTFQWQVSTDGGATWNNIAGATAATYTATQTVASSYRVGIASCGGTVEYSSSVAVALTGFMNCYCNSAATTTADEEITNVTLGTLNNTTTCGVAAPGPGSLASQYSNFTTGTGAPAPLALIQGASVSGSITVGSCGTINYTSGAAIFIDYNQNGLFTDAGELVWSNGAASNINCVPATTLPVSFTVPGTATPGLTRMRIIDAEGYAGATMNPCLSYGYGETEDYMVQILGPCDPTVFTPPLASADDPDATVCGTQTSQLTAFDLNGVATPIYLWYSTPTGGTPLQNSTSNFYNPGPITATTTWYVATNTGSCITDRFPVTLNWVAAPAITATNSNPIFCGSTGSPTDLSVTSSNTGYAYTWSASPATGSGLTAGTTGATVSAVTPTVNGVYTYTVTANDATSGCTASATTTVGFYSPLTGTATVTQPLVCGGNGAVNFAVNGSGTVFTSDFSSATLNPAQAQLCNNAQIVGGQLQFTAPVNSQKGGILITNTTGVASNDFQIDFDMITTAGTTPPADGFSYSYGPDVVCMPTPGATTGDNILVPAGAANPENGSGSGIRLSFDAYTNGVNVNGIYLMYNCLRMNPASTLTPADGLYYYANNTSWIGGATTHVTITINALGQMSMWLSGTQVLNNAQLPAAYLTADKSTWKHAFAARTGGLNQGHLIDNLDIHYNNFYEYSVDNGATWTTTSPVSVPSPSTVQNLARYTAVPSCSVNLGSTAVAFPVAAPTNVTGGSTCLNGTTLNVSANGAPAGGTLTATTTLGTSLTLAGSGTLALTGAVNVPAGATITGAVLSVAGITTTGATYASDITVAMTGVSTVAQQVLSTAAVVTNVSYSYNATIPSGNGNVTVNFINNWTSPATFASVSLIVSYTLPSVPVWFDAATGGNLLGSGSTFNVIGTSYLPNASAPFNGNVYAASVVTNGPSTCYSSTVAAPVTVGQPLTVTVAASAPITQTFTLATAYSVAAGATQTVTGTIAIPAGATVTSTVLQVNGVTSTAGTWGNDVNIAMSGAANVASQVVANVNGGLTNAGPYTYTASNIAAPGGTVFVTITHNYSFGGPMDFGSIAVLVTYTAPVTGSVCPGTSVTLNATTTGGGANPTYQWNLNGSAIAGATSASYVAIPTSATDVYTATVVDDCNPSGVTSAGYSQPLFSVTAGTITGPSAILVNDFTAPIPGAGTWSIAGQTAGSTIQWSYGTAAVGPYTTIGGGTNATQTLYATGGAGTIYLTATTTTTDGCSIQANVVPVALGNAIDTPCTARPVTVGDQGGLSFSTAAATVSTGEVFAPANGCDVQNGWCNTTLNGTVWFSFVAPASGHVSVLAGGWDNQLAIYSATNCADYTTFTLINANDDGGTAAGGATFSAFLSDVKCLIPGTTYYIQLDGYSGVGTSTLVITDLGNIAPSIQFTPSNIAVNNATGTCGNVVTWGVPTPADDQGCVTLTSNFNSGATFPVGVTTVTYTATDAQGLTATSSFTVTVTDNELPTITAPAAVTVNANSSCNATGVALGTPVTADNCTVASVTNNAPATFPLGVTTVTWTVTDASNNVATATQTVTVVDVTNPTITAPAAVTVNANSSCNATGVALGTPVTADNCSVASVTSDAPATFPLGTTTVTWTVTDGAGLTATATQTVTVVDATNPTITAPANVTVNANSSCNATGVVLGTPVTADNCSVASVTSDAPATFPLGTTTVTWTVTDGAGLTATATQTVTVVDATNPTITAPAAVTVTAALNACTATATLGSATTADNCGVASTTNNAPATFPIGTTTVTWTVTDNSGNTATATQVVTVNVNPANLWYVDADGDGYGVAGASVVACSQPAGYAANTTDCNDNNANVNPGAFEICGNAIDDNCNGTAEEGCQFPGENPSNATSITPSVWPSCTLTNGTLAGASISGAAQTICLTGEDKWHQFVATSEGISIVVNSTSADILIELQTAAGALVAQENAVSGIGGEILNHYGLTAGQVYRVGVRNYNSALGTGTYSICVKMLKRGGCDYGPGPYTLCQYFKATWAGATGTNYTFTFTGLTGPAAGNVYTRTQNSDICVLSSVVPTLPYGSTYNVLITNTYSINNGAGVAETISVPALSPCSMTVSTEPTTALRTTDQCAAGPRFRGAVVASLPWVCGATNWRWEFTELNASGQPVGLPITLNRGAASNYINLGTILQLQYGKTYSVRTAPILPYTGTNYQWGAPVCMSIVGTAGMVADGGQANNPTVRMETANEVNMSLYPNPTHGTDVNINLSGVESENVQIRIVDAMGRQVWNNRYSVSGVLNTNITFERPLANGLYMVEAIFNGEVHTQRMMVQK